MCAIGWAHADRFLRWGPEFCKISLNKKTQCVLSLSQKKLSHRVISDEVHRLIVTLSDFRPDRFMQLLSLIPILFLLFYLLVSRDLSYTGNWGLDIWNLLPRKENNCLLRFIQIVLVLKLQVVSALQLNVSVSYKI